MLISKKANKFVLFDTSLRTSLTPQTLNLKHASYHLMAQASHKGCQTALKLLSTHTCTRQNPARFFFFFFFLLIPSPSTYVIHVVGYCFFHFRVVALQTTPQGCYNTMRKQVAQSQHSLGRGRLNKSKARYTTHCTNINEYLMRVTWQVNRMY